MNLTQATVERLALPPGKTDAVFFDDKVPGFGFRLRNGRAATWVFQFKLGPRHYRMTLGRVAAMKAGAARSIAEKHHAAVKDSRNPQIERRVRVAHSANTFGQLVEQYLKFKEERIRPRSLSEVKRHLQVCALPLHRLPVTAINKIIVAQLIKEVAAARGVVSANRVRASLSALFAWSMKETDFVEASPVLSTHRAGEERARTRVLGNDEIAIIWHALAGDDYGAILKLLLLTACRRDEIGSLRWDEADFSRNRVALPPSRCENGRGHHIPMSATVRALLETQRAKRIEGQEFVFARGDRGFSSWSAGRKALDRRIAAAGAALPHWVNHDFRRTASTRMAEDLGVAPHTIEALLNHAKPGISGVYNLSSCMTERAAALALWDDHLAALAQGRQSNVLPLTRA